MCFCFFCIPSRDDRMFEGHETFSSIPDFEKHCLGRNKTTEVNAFKTSLQNPASVDDLLDILGYIKGSSPSNGSTFVIISIGLFWI